MPFLALFRCPGKSLVQHQALRSFLASRPQESVQFWIDEEAGMARLNDTRAIASAPSRSGESYHINTRKIDNGYLVEESICTDTGEYKSSTKFMSSPPTIVPGRVKGSRNGNGPDAAGSSGLGDAVQYARKS